MLYCGTGGKIRPQNHAPHDQFLAGPEQINLIRHLVRHGYEKIFDGLRSCFAFPYGHRVGGSDERHKFGAHRAAASTDRAGLLSLSWRLWVGPGRHDCRPDWRLALLWLVRLSLCALPVLRTTTLSSLWALPPPILPPLWALARTALRWLGRLNSYTGCSVGFSTQLHTGAHSG